MTMKLGIKYCGGCNPRYDRSAAVNALLAGLKEAGPVYDTGVYCPVWLAVCGCPNACVETDPLQSKKTLTVTSAKECLALKKTLPELLSSLTDTGLRELAPGDTAVRTRVFTMEDLLRFARLTGDVNGIHLDPETADRTMFRRPVVHGIFVSSLLSAILGTELPGSGTVLLDEDIWYKAPVFIGENITAELRFLSFSERKSAYIGTFEGICRKEDGTEAVSGVFHELMSKKFFRITDQTKTETADRAETHDAD